jgi:uncharacterized protein YbaP (TraB family)
MKNLIRTVVGLVTLWAFSTGCHTSQKVIYAPDTVAPTDKSLLWRITENGLKQPSYLFGTIHLIAKDDLHFSEATLHALERTKKITFEIDMKEMTSLRTQFSLLTKSFMKDGKTLKDLLSATDYQFVREKMDEKGLPSGMFERIKPMFLSMMLTNDEGGGMGNGKDSKMTAVEMELWHIAKKQKKKSGGLETAEYQMSIFDKIPYEDQAKMLIDGLRTVTPEGGENEMERMTKLYQNQDIEAMQEMIGGDSTGMAEYEDLLLGQRNRNWISVMGRMMLEQPTFFAVGAGHLGGQGGVVALLRKEGYRVEALQ